MNGPLLGGMWSFWLHYSQTCSSYWSGAQWKMKRLECGLAPPKTEAVVLSQKRMACSLQAGWEVLYQVEEFKYFGVLFISEGRIKR